MKNLIEKKNNTRNKVVAAMAGLNSFVMANMVMAFAAENPWSGAETTIKGVVNQFKDMMMHLVVPIAGAALVVCFIMMLISQNQKKVEMYRGWCITIVICIVAIFAIDFIIGLAQNIGESFAAGTAPESVAAFIMPRM